MSKMIERVARALSDTDQVYNGDYRVLAKAAIEAMRDLVKHSSTGCRDDHIKFNRYIDEVLK